ncbi:MAG: lipid-A-disaccharide synthase [Gammaproteobacteria bacterium]|nr:lipid-A-disaccharide synthase [Gammaproteobacteria bacterium]
MKTILFVCGEPSGADYVGDILTRLRAQCPDARLVAVGNSDKAVPGVEYLFHYRVFTHFGFVSVITHLWSVLRAAGIISRWCRDNRPDLVVLVDSPGLNLRLAARIRRYGCAIYYFISPHIWAWNFKRIDEIKKLVDQMYPVLPFEVEIYRRHNIPAVLVQHPKMETYTESAESARPELAKFTAEAVDVVGLLPGSRPPEIKRFIPLLIETAQILLEKNCRIRFIMPVRPGSLSRRQRATLDRALGNTLMVVEGDFRAAVSSCDFCLCASGTACLEVALMRVPMVVYYKLGFIDSLVFRFKVKTRFVSLVNILLNSNVVSECLGNACNPDVLSAEMEALFRRRGHYQNQIDRFERLYSLLTNDKTMAGELIKFANESPAIQAHGSRTKDEATDHDRTQQR